MILAVGNVLNAGTNKERADGFDMEVVKMSKPKGIKGNSGQSLLAYVVMQSIKENPNFSAEMRKLN